MEESKATEPFLASYSSDHEDASTDPEAYCEYDSSKRKVRFPWKYFKYPGMVFLSLGWLVAAGVALQPVHIYTTAIHNSPLPRELFQTVKRSFHMDERYVGPSESANDNWEALIADEEQEKYNLPPGMPSPYYHPNRPDPPPQNFYVLSIMHRMHCLNHIRAHYWQIKTGGPSTPNYTENKWNVHIDHCFEYLRQSTLCGHANFEIEGYTPLFVPGEGVATTVSGWGIEHDCVDYDSISAFQIAREHEYNLTWFEA
ncbi:Protein of unknown function DUF3328 [Penicillium occitanis (nom. inval.)]|nr:Protein of unknown function DUF3328 [Penicillium occitanis (nom. inval.)]PCG91012.1 hypothetical protein PENOC_099320 [Penicillium occitanis (nom. inval.)]